MRPYLAIVKDSFVEALASRVLWVLLILITLVLLALAPLGFRSERTTEFRRGDFRDGRELIKEVRGQFESDESSPGFRIWSNFDKETQQQLAEFQEDEEEGRVSYFAGMKRLVEGLNKLLEKRDLYDEKAWEGVLLGSEARELLGRGLATLAEHDLARLNRLLIVKPFEDSFHPQLGTQVLITYIGFRVSPPIPFSEKRIRQIIEQYVLPSLIGLLVGFVGVLTAILVTAPIIPQMFDAGALSLLLSKPLSRSLMFLAKFAGGCAFIFINVTYLIIGLWAIAGLRFGIWNQGLLLCIPIFLFLFAIYYSVSAITGVIWRNAVVSVVMTVVFWLVCTVVGATKNIFEQVVIETRKMVRVVNAGDALIALDEKGATKRWNAEKAEWEPVFLEDGGGPMQQVLGPVYDPQHNMLLAGRTGSRNFFNMGSNLLIGKGSDGWKQVDGPPLPEDTVALFPDPKGRALAVTNSGVQRLVGDLDLNEKKMSLFGFEIPRTLGKPFRSAGPEPSLKLTWPTNAAVDRRSGNVVIYSRGQLMLLPREADDYTLAKSVAVEAEADEGVAIALQGRTLLLALADGRVVDYDSTTLQPRRAWQPEPHSQPRFACASPDGRWFAVVFHNGRLHVLDTGAGTAGMRAADVRGQGDISAVEFSEDGQMMVIDRATRLNQYRMDTMELAKSYAPALSGIEIAYYYAVVPIYAVFPKPGELDNTVQYLVQKQETIDMGMQMGNLQAKRVRLRPWAPVRSSLIFMLVVLGLACVYIERQDF
ncbi:MAG: hypothetical protein FJ276_07685 [Planctomycetes bacterium]|nr:hypothetical protein [Planctomycetota bacterium]